MSCMKYTNRTGKEQPAFLKTSKKTVFSYKIMMIIE